MRTAAHRAPSQPPLPAGGCLPSLSPRGPLRSGSEPRPSRGPRQTCRRDKGRRETGRATGMRRARVDRGGRAAGGQPNGRASEELPPKPEPHQAATTSCRLSRGSTGKPAKHAHTCGGGRRGKGARGGPPCMAARPRDCYRRAAAPLPSLPLVLARQPGIPSRPPGSCSASAALASQQEEASAKDDAVPDSLQLGPQRGQREVGSGQLLRSSRGQGGGKRQAGWEGGGGQCMQ